MDVPTTVFNKSDEATIAAIQNCHHRARLAMPVILLIERAQRGEHADAMQRLHQDIEKTNSATEELSRIHGLVVKRSLPRLGWIVVTGTAEQVSRAIELPYVKSAVLDESILKGPQFER